MMARLARFTPCLWLDDQAEAAAQFYTAIFPHSKIVDITHFGEAGQEIHGKEPGSVMTVEFELDGQPFTALNGGPMFKFNEAISFQVRCDTQEEVDYYWDKLSAGGDPAAQQCGWLKDQFGLSWQVVPGILHELLKNPDPRKSQNVMKAMFTMKKIDIAKLKQAAG
jgi:predicted 3-demethylubiquinone-9 3-methyltransferase (glyoxalase superfamily)